MECCATPMNNWSYHHKTGPTTKIPHFSCQKCGKHFHAGQWYTTQEWFFYVNEMTHEHKQG